jgi:hypothetical protein
MTQEQRVELTPELIAQHIAAMQSVDTLMQQSLHQLAAAINNSALVMDRIIAALKDHNIEVDLPPHLRKE